MLNYKLRSLLLLTTAIGVLSFYCTKTTNEKILPKLRISECVVKLSAADCTHSNLRSLVLETNDEVTAHVIWFSSVQLEESMVMILSKARNIKQILFSDCNITPDLLQKLDKTSGLEKVTCFDCHPISKPIDDKIKRLQLSFSIDVVRCDGYKPEKFR